MAGAGGYVGSLAEGAGTSCEKGGTSDQQSLFPKSLFPRRETKKESEVLNTHERQTRRRQPRESQRGRG